MILSFSLVFAIVLAGGWLFGKLFSILKLPSILGMVVFGIICSFAIKAMTPTTLWELGPFLKSFALIVILLRAGLSISKQTLKKVGLTALLMSFVPCVFEGAALTVLFKIFFGFDWYVSGLTAFMLSAVSPAVIVPSMLDLKRRERGKRNEVPTIIMAGASIDDVFAITIFSVFLGLARSSEVSLVGAVLSIPLSIGIGIVSGIAGGFLLSAFFKWKHRAIRATEKAILLIVGGMLLVQVGDHFHFAALLGIMTLGFILLERHEAVAHELAAKLSKIWVFAEIVLFVMIGFSLDIRAAADAGLKGLGVIALGLVFRSLGVFIATAFSKLSWKERLFCAIAYLPKATVQAALGGVALSYGLAEGQTILAIAVIAILFTAPLGLLGIRLTSDILLGKDEGPAVQADPA